MGTYISFDKPFEQKAFSLNVDLDSLYEEIKLMINTIARK